jgi:hypothetical protein
MATRGLIAVIKDGVVTASYNHYDSYESNLGVALNTFFNTPEKAEEIANMGDIRYVSSENGEVELLSNPKPPKKLYLSNSLEDAAEELAKLIDAFGADYAYIFNENKWEVVKNRGIRSMIDPIEDILFSDFENEDDRMSQSDIELDESIVRNFKYKAGIIK